MALKNLYDDLPNIPPSDEESTFVLTPLPTSCIDETLNAMASFSVDTVEDIMERGETREYAEDIVRQVVWCDVAKINKYWSRNTKLFIPPFARSNDDWKKDWKGYFVSKTRILKGEISEPPNIQVSKDERIILFENGRHRFANLRDSKVPAVPCIILRCELQEFQKLGLVLRRSSRTLKRSDV